MMFGRRRAPCAACSVELAVACDRAALLYKYGEASVGLTAASSAIITFVFAGATRPVGLLAWFGVLSAVQVARLADALDFYRVRCGPFDGRNYIRRFGLGSAASAVLWAAMPPCFFSSLSLTARLGTLLTIAAMGSGSATVLSPSLPLALFYCLALIFPAACTALVMPTPLEHILGWLALGQCAALLFAARASNRSSVGALRLSRENEILMARADEQRRETATANRELAAAQVALAELNQALEDRVEQRTAELAEEVRARERYADALAQLASTDPLTGLTNRATFSERLARMLAGAEREPSSLAVLFLDIDNFKQINDVRGHDAGDRVLQSVARVLATQAPAAAEISRWGGDEFLIAIPRQGGTSAEVAARQLREALTEPMDIGTDTVRVEATIGVALFPIHGCTQDELIRAADVAMYEAKREGKGRVKLFDPTLAQDMAERYTLEQGLRHALARRELLLAFQPIVLAKDGRTCAFEALLRWRHPARGMISPAQFIPVAEQSGQIDRISRWVLGEACREATGWTDPTIAVTVNISVAHVLTGTLIADVEAALADSGLAPARLQLEITESMFLGDHVRAAPALATLRNRGIRILLDDFGTGYSSLAYLGDLPIDVIKIDRSFIAHADRDGFATVGAILSIAHALGMEVTAEGVETNAQRNKLCNLGVQRLQGFLFSKPMLAAEVDGWIARHAAPKCTPAAESVRWPASSDVEFPSPRIFCTS